MQRSIKEASKIGPFGVISKNIEREKEDNDEIMRLVHLVFDQKKWKEKKRYIDEGIFAGAQIKIPLINIIQTIPKR